MKKKLQNVEYTEPLIIFEEGLKIRSVQDNYVQETVVNRCWGGITYATDSHQKLAVDLLAFLIKNDLAISSLVVDAANAKAQISLIGIFFDGLVRRALLRGQAEKLKSFEFGFLLNQALEVGCYLLQAEDLDKIIAQFRLKKDPRKKLGKLIEKIQTAFEKCSENHERAYRAAEGIVDIEFLAAEYIKRRFVQDLRRDNSLRGKAHSVSSVLRSFYRKWMKEAPALCPDCVWANDGHEAVPGLPFLKRGACCGSRNCEFKIRISKGIDLFAGATNQLHSNAVSEFRIYDFPADPDTAALLEEAFELANTYGLYPYDLLTFAQVDCYLSTGGSLPKPNFYFMPAESNKKSGKSKLPQLEALHQVRKKQFGSEKYHETIEGRLVGIWLWDELNLVPKESQAPATDTIQQLFYQYWFWALPMGKTDCETYCKADTKLDYETVTDRRRRELNLAKECINRGKILPFSAIEHKPTE
jgi:hypothetical protein